MPVRGGLLVAAFMALWASIAPEAGLAGDVTSAKKIPVAEPRRLLDEGRYADAEERAREALGLLSRGGRGGSLAAAELMDILVVSLWRGGKATGDDAVRFAERAIEVKERLLGMDDPGLAISLDNAGVLFFLRGQYDRSQNLYQRALSIRKAAAAKDSRYAPDVATVHSHLGPLFQELGQYSTARRHYERALGIFVKAGADDRRIAMSRNNLATLLTKMGDYGRALPLYRASLSSLQSLLGPEHPLIATAKHNLGELNQRLGRDDEAIELYRQSVALKEKALGMSHPSLALTLGNLSYLYSDRGETDAAGRFAQRALEIQETAHGAEHVELAYSLISLGRAQAARGDTEAAGATLERALALRTRVLGADNPLVAPVLHFLSATLLRHGEPRRALALALRAEAITRKHLRLTARGAPQRQALRYAAERVSSLDLVLSIAAGLRDDKASEAAWDALIRSRAVVLDEMAARRRLANRVTTPALQAAVDDYGAAVERLSNVLLRGPTAGGMKEYRRRVAGLRAGKETAERSLAAKGGASTRHPVGRRVGYAEVSGTLPRNAVLVGFARIGRDRLPVSRDPEYIAFVLDGADGSPRIVSLGAARAIETAIRRWRDEMTPGAPARDASGHERAGERLRELIWDPLGIGVRDDRLVLIVPAGALHLVNFAALKSPDGRFLAEAEVLLHYLSSERDMIIRDRSSGARPQLLAIGGASRTTPAAPQGSPPFAPAGERRAPGVECAVFSREDFPPLPGAAQEVRRITELWDAREEPGAGTAILLLGDAATENAFRQQAPGKSVVHVAAHGFFIANHCTTAPGDARSPLRLSGIVLPAGTRHDLGRPGILLAEELAAMDFSRAEWVVLSGCDTGLGRIQVDEGIVGLGRAFHIAGAGTLVMSLWPVEDLAAGTFMLSLYRARLNDRRSTAASMRRAYRDALAATRREHGHSHPLYWAPFIASGDWR